MLGLLPRSDRQSPREGLAAPGCRWLGCRRPATHMVGWVVSGVGVVGSYCPPHAAAIRSASRLTDVWISCCWSVEAEGIAGAKGQLFRDPETADPIELWGSVAAAPEAQRHGGDDDDRQQPPGLVAGAQKNVIGNQAENDRSRQ